MRKNIFLLIICLLVCINCFSDEYERVHHHIVAIDIAKGLPINALKGSVYGTYRELLTPKEKIKNFSDINAIDFGTAKKIQNITSDIFDYVFYVDYNVYGRITLWPLSSGQYENKPIPYVILLDYKKINKKYNFSSFLSKYFIVLDRDDGWYDGLSSYERSKGVFHFNNGRKEYDNGRGSDRVYSFMERYDGAVYGAVTGYDGKTTQKGYCIPPGDYRYHYGIYYKYFFNEKTYKIVKHEWRFKDMEYDNLRYNLKDTANAEDLELMSKTVGYEILYDHRTKRFGIVEASIHDTTNVYWDFKDRNIYRASHYKINNIHFGKEHWIYPPDAIDYLDSKYLSGSIIQADIKVEVENVNRCGWAYFSNRGKGNIKYKKEFIYESQYYEGNVPKKKTYKLAVVFSGFSKNGKVVDEVFLIQLPESKDKYRTDPAKKPAKVKHFGFYRMYGQNIYYIGYEDNGYEELVVDKSLVEDLKRNLEFYDNKSGVYYGDPWVNVIKVD